jgi:hypothetical protein
MNVYVFIDYVYITYSPYTHITLSLPPQILEFEKLIMYIYIHILNIYIYIYIIFHIH